MLCQARTGFAFRGFCIASSRGSRLEWARLKPSRPRSSSHRATFLEEPDDTIFLNRRQACAEPADVLARRRRGHRAAPARRHDPDGAGRRQEKRGRSSIDIYMSIELRPLLLASPFIGFYWTFSWRLFQPSTSRFFLSPVPGLQTSAAGVSESADWPGPAPRRDASRDTTPNPCCAPISVQIVYAVPKIQRFQQDRPQSLHYKRRSTLRRSGKCRPRASRMRFCSALGRATRRGTSFWPLVVSNSISPTWI
jgi:hypothetical protein